MYDVACMSNAMADLLSEPVWGKASGKTSFMSTMGGGQFLNLETRRESGLMFMVGSVIHPPFTETMLLSKVHKRK